MTFSIIGTGNVAWLFAKRIAAAGHRCIGVYGRDAEATKKLADAVLSDKCGAISDVRDGDVDVCFLAVSDRAIEEVAKQLHFKETILVHCAGAQELDIIKNAAKDCAVLWPVYSILKTHLPAHRNIPCAWEVSSDRAKRYVLEMGHAITDTLFEAKGAQRKSLHLAAVFSNNFINHLLAINEELCKENDLPVEVLQPLMAQAFETTRHSSPHDVQTGPAIRRDEATIARHKALLQNHPDFLKVYEALTDSIQSMYPEEK